MESLVVWIALAVALIALGEATYNIFAMNHLADRSLAAMRRLEARIQAIEALRKS